LILLGAVVAISSVFSAFLVNDGIGLVLAPLVLEFDARAETPANPVPTTAGIATSGLQVGNNIANHFRPGNPGGPGRPKGSRNKQRHRVDLAQMIVNGAERAGFKTIDTQTGKFVPGDGHPAGRTPP
jgi:hypothetical protein